MDKICKTCGGFDICIIGHAGRTAECPEWRPGKSDPMTNGDRIRAMSDEELSKFIPDWSYTNACKCDEHYVDCNIECKNCVLEWLKQPAEVN
jgi:hypothetical protein